VVNERYPMSDDEYLELAGIQAAVSLYGKGGPQNFQGQFFRSVFLDILCVPSTVLVCEERDSGIRTPCVARNQVSCTYMIGMFMTGVCIM
jgi:hypothetical protein